MYPQSSRVVAAPNDLDAQRSLDETVTCYEMAGQATQAECRTMVLTNLLLLHHLQEDGELKT